MYPGNILCTLNSHAILKWSSCFLMQSQARKRSGVVLWCCNLPRVKEANLSLDCCQFESFRATGVEVIDGMRWGRGAELAVIAEVCDQTTGQIPTVNVQCVAVCRNLD